MKNLLSIAVLILTLLTGVLLLPEPAVPPPDTATGESVTSPSTAGGEATVIRNARVFDGEQMHEAVSLLLQDGLVQQIGADIEIPASAMQVDATGKTVLPGLIDAHVHSFGSARTDALRFGVTTMLDMFRPPDDFDRTHAERSSLEPTERSDLYSAGILATAAGGHGTQYGIDVPTLNGPEQAAAWVSARKAEGSDWIKIVIEPGWGNRPLPTLDRDTVQALIEAAHASGLLAVAHVSNYADALLAIECGIDGLMHLFGDRQVDEPFIQAARASKLFVVPTSPVLAGIYGHDDTAWIVNHTVLGPRLTAMQRDSLATRFPAPDDDGSVWPNVQANILALHAAGIPILAGSDAANPATTYGASLHHAMRLLVNAGLEPIAALRAASSNPANAFGLDGRGCLQAGCRADLVIVQGNPVTDIEATAMIDSVWKNGQRVEFAALPSLPGSAAEGISASGSQDLLAQPGRWMAAADDYAGGASKASMKWVKPEDSATLAVNGRLEPGQPIPYAGAMWFASNIPMQPEDHSEHSRLLLDIDGAASNYQVMLFSGPNQNAQPLPVSIESGRMNSIELDAIDGLDLTRLRAIGVFASGAAGEVDFRIVQARLE